MGRIRTIKPEMPQSESMGRLTRDARLLFILLWTLADDAGRLRGNSRMLASLLYPYDSDVPKLIDKWLEELDKEKCTRRYEVEGQRYLEIVNWLKHQKIDKPSPSRIPPFDSIRDESAKVIEVSTTDLVPSTVDRGPSTKPSGDEFTLPAWIDKDAWKGFEEMRRKIRAPLTDRARNGIVKDLQKLCGVNDNGAAILDQSTNNGYRGVFALKGNVLNGTTLFPADPLSKMTFANGGKK